MDDRYTKRITPLYNVICTCLNKEVARQWLKEYAIQLNEEGVSTALYPDKLSIIYNPGVEIAYTCYIMVETVLYGSKIGEYVFNLEARSGRYLIDQDFPYRYIDRGWFSSIEWIHKTKDWQIMKELIYQLGGIIEENHVQLRRTDNESFVNYCPSLFIRPYKLLR